MVHSAVTAYPSSTSQSDADGLLSHVAVSSAANRIREG